MDWNPLIRIATAATLAVASLGLASPAHATGSDAAQAADAEAAIADVASIEDAAVIGITPTVDGTIAIDDGAIAELPADPDDGLALTGSDGTTIGIDLPVTANVDDARVVDRTTAIYTDAMPGTSLAAQALDAGGVRALIVIEDGSAPSEYRFSIDAGAGSTLELQEDGSVNLIGSDGDPIGHFAAPWAYDADNRPVPTSYRIEGMDIVQAVHHKGSEYPVVADPKYTWGWVTGTVYFNRAETRSMRTFSYGAIIAAGLCTAFALETAGAACAIGGAFMAQWQYVATNAYGDGKCVKIKIPTFWASAYSGGYCS